MENAPCSTSLLRANQVLINCAEIIVYRRDGLDLNVTLRNDLVKQEIESIRVACLYKQAVAIVMQTCLHHFIGLEHARGQQRWSIATNQDLHWMLDIHFVAYT